jgi:hypothetical protein
MKRPAIASRPTGTAQLWGTDALPPMPLQRPTSLRVKRPTKRFIDKYPKNPFPSYIKYISFY